MKLFPAAVAVGVGIGALLQPAQSKEDVVRVVSGAENTFFMSKIDAAFSTRQLQSSSTPTYSPTVHPLKGTPLPAKCEDEINSGRSLSKFCTKWLEVNDDFIMPTHSPSEAPSAAPSPFYKVQSSTVVDDNDRSSLVLDISAVDDTFIELFRPNIPLGDKTNVKIDAMGGLPTKVTMLKFNIGESFNRILLNQNVGVSLKSAKLQLYAKATGTTNQFGGYIEEIDGNWSEETAVWGDYVRGGPAAKKDAANLLPSANNTLASLEAVSSSTWTEADVTERLREIFAGWSNTTVSQFAVRITTDISEGVVYGSKEDIEFGPKLSLVFEFQGTSLEVAAAAAAASNHGETTMTSKPTLSATSSLPTPSFSPTSNPTVATNSPVVSTASPIAATASPVVTTSPPSTSSPVVNTMTPSANPTRAPSPLPTPSPTSAEVREETTETSAAVMITATSVVSQTFQLKIVATAEEVRERNLKGSRELSFFMSVNDKERPALAEHLMNVYNETLTSSPERVEIIFVNENMDVDIEIVNSNEVIRSSMFKISAIFVDPRIASIAADEASAVLDRATLHAFTGAENTAFVSILKETGEPIISSSEQISAAVSKMSFLIGNTSDQSSQAATAPEASVETQNERSNDEAGWAGPALAIGASLVVVASALASVILIRQRRHQYSYDETHKNSNSLMSPTNTEAVTPSPKSFADRFRKKKFDYTEFEDPEDQSTGRLDYDFNPVTPRKFDTEQPVNFECPPNINISHFQCRSFDDSTVSDVSAHIYAKMGRSPERNTTVADGDKSGIESEQFRFDNVLGNDNDLNVDGSASDFLVDDDSGDVPSELYSHMSMDDSTSMQSHALHAVYGAHTFILENLHSGEFLDMPPPPSDAASENSSQQDFPSDPIYGNDEGDTLEPRADESYQKAINDELTKVMMILDTEDDKMEDDDDDNAVDHGSVGDGDGDVRAVTPISNVYDVPYMQGVKCADVNADESVQSSIMSEDDPVKLMNSALDDCMTILDKARPKLL